MLTLALTLLAWLPPDSIAGLGGSYAATSHGPIIYVTFDATSDDGGRVDGTYTRFASDGDGLIVMQTGRFGALANNPAIGPFIVFSDDAGNFRDAYAILGITRDPLGKHITALELADARDGSTFVLVRVGL